MLEEKNALKLYRETQGIKKSFKSLVSEFQESIEKTNELEDVIGVLNLYDKNTSKKMLTECASIPARSYISPHSLTMK